MVILITEVLWRDGYPDYWSSLLRWLSWLLKFSVEMVILITEILCRDGYPEYLSYSSLVWGRPEYWGLQPREMWPVYHLRFYLD
jgi:hypothetical protein